MRHLFENWRQIGQRLRSAETVALFLDFDGTLAAVRARPEQAALDGATRRALRQLVHCPRMQVCVISGRKLDDVSSRLRVPGIAVMGLHGWDRESSEHGPAARALGSRSSMLIDNARRELAARLTPDSGVWIEDKGPTFSVHFRGAATPAIRQARTALAEVLDPLRGALRVLHGDQVWEVVPREVRGKGVAARRRFRAFRHALPVYAGNDATDEPAFQALARGVTIRVGPVRPSRARFSLRSPAEVRQFLERILEEMR